MCKVLPGLSSSCGRQRAAAGSGARCTVIQYETLQKLLESCKSLQVPCCCAQGPSCNLGQAGILLGLLQRIAARQASAAALFGLLKSVKGLHVQEAAVMHLHGGRHMLR